MSQKTCKICTRTRNEELFPMMSRRYRRPYCRPCYNAYQSWWGKIDREQNRSLTVTEFKDEILPVLIETGNAAWVGPEPLTVRDDGEVDPFPFPNAKNEVEKKIRHNAIMEALRQTSSPASD